MAINHRHPCDSVFIRHADGITHIVLWTPCVHTTNTTAPQLVPFRPTDEREWRNTESAQIDPDGHRFRNQTNAEGPFDPPLHGTGKVRDVTGRGGTAIGQRQRVFGG